MPDVMALVLVAAGITGLGLTIFNIYRIIKSNRNKHPEQRTLSMSLPDPFPLQYGVRDWEIIEASDVPLQIQRTEIPVVSFVYDNPLEILYIRLLIVISGADCAEPRHEYYICYSIDESNITDMLLVSFKDKDFYAENISDSDIYIDNELIRKGDRTPLYLNSVMRFGNTIVYVTEIDKDV